MAERDIKTKLSSGQFAAAVSVHKKRLSVYEVEHDEEERKFTCYIEAHGGDHFSVVHFNDGDQASSEEGDETTAWDVSTYLDGVKVGGVVYGPDSIIYSQPKGEARQQSLKGHQDSSTTYQPFIFAQIRVAKKPEKACTDTNRLDALGTIQVRITRVEASSLKECTTDAYRPLVEIEEYEKEEIDKKQLSYQTKLGPSLAAVPESRVTFKLIDPVDKPYLTFEFRYRSKSLLQRLDILSRESSGLSSISGDESTTLKKDSSTELAAGAAPEDKDKKPSLPTPPRTISKPKLKPLEIQPNFKVEKAVEPSASASGKQKAAPKDKGKGKLKARIIEELELSDGEDKKPVASSSKPKPPPTASAPKKQSTFKPLVPKPKASTSSAAQVDHITHYISDSESSSDDIVLQASTTKSKPSTAPAPTRKVSVANPAAKVKGQAGARKPGTNKGKGKRPASSSDDDPEHEKQPVVKSAPKKKKVKRESTPPPPQSPTSPKSRKTLNSTSTPITDPHSVSITPKPKTKPQPKKRPLSPTDDEDLPQRIASLPSSKIHKKVKKEPEEERSGAKVEEDEGRSTPGSSTEKEGGGGEGMSSMRKENGKEVDEFAMMMTEH